MNKAYKRINWENKPSTASPINETNMNKMDYALDTVDTRVVELYNQKDAMASATINANKAADSANAAATSANTAAFNANEAAQAVLDEKYILTARTEMVRSGTARPTAKGNAILEKLTGDGWQRKLIGKNLFNIDGEINMQRDGTIATTYRNTVSNNIITVTNNNAVTMSKGQIISGVAGKTITISLNLISLGSGTGFYIYIIESGVVIETLEYTSLGIITYTHSCSADEVLVSFQTIQGENSQISNVQIELGTEATEYEPYCDGIPSPNPSFKQDIRSTGDMGWFDGEWLQGYYSYDNGKYNTTTNRVCTKNSIPCKSGDKISITPEISDVIILIVYYTDSGYLSYKAETSIVGGQTYDFTVPNSATKFVFTIESIPDITPSTVGHICVTINGKYAAIVDEVGKNLWNEEWEIGALNSVNGNNYNVSNRIRAKDYITIEPNTVYSVSSMVANIYYYREDKTFIQPFSLTSNTFTTRSDAKYIRIEFVYNYGTTYKNDMCISKGTDTTYTPYQHKRTYIPLDEPLRKNDRICCLNGLYGVMRRRNYKIYDGSPDEVFTVWYESDYHSFKTDIVDAKPTATESEIGDVICSHLIAQSHGTAYSGGKDSIAIMTSGVVGIGFENIASIDELKAWLAENPITIDYPLAEPIFIPFEDQTPFYNLMAYDEITHVSIAGLHEELQPTITMRFPRHEDGALVTTSYCNSVKEKIRNDELEARVNELTAAMLALSQS